jgi:hypothetical protein
MGPIYQLFVEFQQAYDSVRRQVWCNLIESGIPMKLVRLIIICLSETSSKFLKG